MALRKKKKTKRRGYVWTFPKLNRDDDDATLRRRTPAQWVRQTLSRNAPTTTTALSDPMREEPKNKKEDNTMNMSVMQQQSISLPSIPLSSRQSSILGKPIVRSK